MSATSSGDRTNRVALILRAQGTTYAAIADLLGITAEEARQAVYEGMQEAQIEQPDESAVDQDRTKLLAVSTVVMDALWMMASNFQNLSDIGVPGFSRRVNTANRIREQLAAGELEIRKARKE